METKIEKLTHNSAKYCIIWHYNQLSCVANVHLVRRSGSRVALRAALPTSRDAATDDSHEIRYGSESFHRSTVELCCCYCCGMQIGLRHFGSETIERLISASGEPGATRSGLARLLCEVCDWKDSQERLALSSHSPKRAFRKGPRKWRRRRVLRRFRSGHVTGAGGAG